MRGLDIARKKRLVRETIKKAKVDIVKLQETKLELLNNNWVRSIYCIRDK